MNKFHIYKYKTLGVIFTLIYLVMVSFISVDSHNAVNLTVLLACMGHQSVAFIIEIKLSAMVLCLIKKNSLCLPTNFHLKTNFVWKDAKLLMLSLVVVGIKSFCT